MKITKIFIAVCMVLSCFSAVQAEKNPYELIIQNGHNEDVKAVRITRDMKYFVTGSDDRTIKIWTIDGKIIRSIFAGQKVADIFLSPDCSRIYARFETLNVVYVYSFNGEIIKRLELPESVQGITLSRDGLRFAAWTRFGQMWIYDTRSWNKTSFSVEESYTEAQFNEEGAQIAVVEQTIITVRKTDGSIIKSMKKPDGTGLFTSDLRKLYYVSKKNELVEKDMFSGKERILMYNPKYSASYISVYAVSRNGKYIIVNGYNDQKKGTFDIYTADGRKKGSILIKQGTARCAEFSDDSSFAVAGLSVVDFWKQNFAQENILRFKSDGEELNRIKAMSDGVIAAAITPDNKKIVSLANDFRIVIRSYTGSLLDIIEIPGRRFSRMVLTRDGKYIIALKDVIYQGGKPQFGSVCIYTIDGELIREIVHERHKEPITSIAVSDDNRYILCGLSVSIYGTSAKDIPALLYSFDGKLIEEIKNGQGSITSVAVSHNGKLILTGDDKNEIRLFKRDGELIRTITGFQWRIWSLAFLHDNKRFIASSSNSDNTRIYNIEGDKMISLKDPEFSGHKISSVAVSPDDSLLASGGETNKVYLWNSNGKLLKSHWHNNGVESVSFSADGRYIVSASKDGTVKLWDYNSDRIFTYITSGDEWMIFDDKKNWDGSKGCGIFVVMAEGTNAVGIDQFALISNRPDLILSSFNERDLVEHYRQQYYKRLKKLGLSEGDLSFTAKLPQASIENLKISGKNAAFRAAFSDASSGLKMYNVYVNDVPLYGANGKDISGKSKTINETIELTHGKNKIEVSCINDKGAESYRALAYADYNKPVTGDLYYIGFGVSKYKDNLLDLKYADKDARDLAEMYSSMKNGYKNVIVKTYLNEEVTVENIKQAKDLLKNAKPDDTFVLFIAGHGMHDTDKEATYYYLTHNADRDNISGTCANFDLIEDLMQGIAPRNKLFLMDTCESGEIEEAAETGFITAADSRGIKARSARAFVVKGKAKSSKRTYLFQKDRYIYNDLVRRSGAIVFSSSKGGEFSYESDKIQNGFFTKEIISAIRKMSADKNGDGTVTTDELRDYVSHNVEKATGGLQHPTVDRDNLYQKFGFSGK